MCMNWQTNKPCLLSKARQRNLNVNFALCSNILIALGVFLQETQPVAAVKWFRHDACTDPVPCRESDQTCVGPTCDKHWESCPSGTAQYGTSNFVADEGNCSWTGCDIGGCAEGWEEKDHKDCFLESQCLKHAGFCRNEYCCALRPQVKCCQLLPCTPVYDECQMPERLYPEDPSHSETGTVSIAHQGHADFAFYSVESVPYGGSCEDVRVLGRCLCDDGRKVPGCEPTNSSSWLVRNATTPENTPPQPPASPSAADNTTTGPPTPTSNTPPQSLLPAALSLTCIVQQPHTPPPPDTPSSTAEATASASSADLDLNDDDNDDNQLPSQPPLSTSPPPPPPPPKKQHPRSSGAHGGLVAGIVLGCLLLAGASVGTVLWCCGLCPNWHVLRMQTMTSYEPIFTGQAYNPGLDSRLAHTASGGLAAADEIPWSRFCTAVGDVYRRVRHGKRYRDERSDAAAAAERYRALNSLSARRLSYGNGTNNGGEGGDLRKGPTCGSMGAIPRLRGSVTNGTPDSYDDQDDDADVDEVFTLDDLRTGGSYGGYSGPTGPRLPVSTAPPPLTPTVRRDAPAPIGLWRLGGPTAAAPAPAELEMEAVGRSAQQRATTTAAVAPPYVRGVSRDSNDVIHTRQLNLSEDEGAADSGRGGGGADSDDSDLDAPLHLLPSPQITGRSARTGCGGGGGGGGKGAR